MDLRRFACIAFILFLAGAARAEDARPVAVRATIGTVSSDGSSFTAKTRDGQERTVHVNPKTRFVLVRSAALADVKPGTFIGVAAMPTDSGEQKALDVHIFPEAMRGTGEGFRPYDIAPGSTMTNGNVDARVDNVNGPRLTVTYKGGKQTILVDPSTPIVAFEPGASGDVKSGAAILARGPAEADGTIDAAFVLIGKDGLTPPL
ncbi:MAG TPA: hypothetical protein VEH77_16525 [Roseiarcus sp.]|nr:hypothetical protein [Roseiarcus sp.]